MKGLFLVLMVIVLAGCTGHYHTSGSATIGTYGGSVSGMVSGPGASGTVTVPVPAQ